MLIEHLETNLTAACQNRCANCNHFVPLQADDFKATFADPDQFAADLEHFGRVAKARVWAAIGGEPLLHPRLVEFLKIAKRSPAVGCVEVRTNGQALKDVGEDFWSNIDLLVVTPYADKLSKSRRQRIAELAEEYFVGLTWHEPDFVRLLEPPTDPQKTLAKYRTCWFKTYCRVLDRGFFFRCCTTPFIPRLLLGRAFGTDGLAVDENLTEAALEAYLASPEPAASCAVCVGMATPSTVPVRWYEVEGRAAWLEASGLYRG
jgi:cyclic pyranopterin phosphate synthase